MTGPRADRTLLTRLPTQPHELAGLGLVTVDSGKVEGCYRNGLLWAKLPKLA